MAKNTISFEEWKRRAEAVRQGGTMQNRGSQGGTAGSRTGSMSYDEWKRRAEAARAGRNPFEIEEPNYGATPRQDLFSKPSVSKAPQAEPIEFNNRSGEQRDMTTSRWPKSTQTPDVEPNTQRGGKSMDQDDSWTRWLEQEIINRDAGNGSVSRNSGKGPQAPQGIPIPPNTDGLDKSKAGSWEEWIVGDKGTQAQEIPNQMIKSGEFGSAGRVGGRGVLVPGMMGKTAEGIPGIWSGIKRGTVTDNTSITGENAIEGEDVSEDELAALEEMMRGGINPETKERLSFPELSRRKLMSDPNSKLSKRIQAEIDKIEETESIEKEIDRLLSPVSDEDYGTFLGSPTEAYYEAMSRGQSQSDVIKMARGRELGVFDNTGRYELYSPLGRMKEKHRLQRLILEEQRLMNKAVAIENGWESAEWGMPEPLDLLRAVSSWDENTEIDRLVYAMRESQQGTPEYDEAEETLKWMLQAARDFIESPAYTRVATHLSTMDGDLGTETIRQAYDAIKGEGAYDAATAEMDEQQIKRLNSRIWEVIRNPIDKSTDVQREIEAHKRLISYYEDQISLLEAFDEQDDTYSELMEGAPEEDVLLPEAFDRGRSEVDVGRGVYDADIHQIVSFVNKGREYSGYMSFFGGLDEIDDDSRFGVTSEYKGAMMMLPEEIRMLTSLYLEEVQEGKEPTRAIAFLEGLQPSLNARYRTYEEMQNKAMARTMPVSSSLGSAMLSVVGGTVNAAKLGIGRATGAQWTKDPFGPGFAAARYTSDIEGQVSKDLGGGTGGKLYQAGMSAIKNIMRVGMASLAGGSSTTAKEVLTLMNFFGEDYFATYQQKLEETGDDNKAGLYAFVDGMIATFFETASVDKIYRGNPSSWFRFMTAQGLIEASEEVNEELFGHYIHKIFDGEDEWEKRVGEILANGGYDDNGTWVTVGRNDIEKAWRRVGEERTERIITAAGSAFISAFGSTGGSMINQSLQDARMGTQIWRNAQSEQGTVERALGRERNGLTEQIADESEQAGEETSTESRKRSMPWKGRSKNTESGNAKTEDNKTSMANEARATFNLIESAEKMGQDTVSNKEAQQLRKKIRRGKNITARDIGKLARTIITESDQSIEGIVRDTVENIVRQDLRSAGVAEEDIGKLSEAFQRGLIDRNLGRADAALIGANEKAAELWQTYNTERSSDIEYEIRKRTETTRQIRDSVEAMITPESDGRNRYEELTRDAQTASTEELEEAEGERTGHAVEAVAEGKISDITGISFEERTITEQDENGEEKTQKVVVPTVTLQDGRTVDAVEVRAVNRNVAQVLEMARQDRGRTISTELFSTLLREAENTQDMARTIADAMKIRWAVSMETQVPATRLSADLHREIMQQAQQEKAKAEGRLQTGFREMRPGQGSTTFEGEEYGTERFKEALKNKKIKRQIRNEAMVIGSINQSIGGKVELYYDEKDTGNQGVFYSGTDGKIRVNLAGTSTTEGRHRNAVATFAHEMTHYLAANSKQAYGRLRSFVLQNARWMGINVQNELTRIMETYARHGENLNVYDAIEELIAKASEQVLTDEKVVQRIKENDPNLHGKLKQTVNELLGRLLGRGVKTKSGERSVGMATDIFETSSIISQEMYRLRNEIGKAWSLALEEAQGERRTETETESRGQNSFSDIQEAIQGTTEKQAMRILKESGEIAFAPAQYSFAGPSAAKEFASDVIRAGEMARNGATEEEIRKETNCVKGYNGRYWRVLDNNNMRLTVDLNSVKEGEIYLLREIYDAEELYRAYPWIRTSAKVVFTELTGTAFAEFHADRNIIAINTKYLARGAEAIEADLQHEIQHFIQMLERSNAGSNTTFWKQMQDIARARLTMNAKFMETIHERYGFDSETELEYGIEFNEDGSVNEQWLTPEEIKKVNNMPADVLLSYRNAERDNEKWLKLLMGNKTAGNLYRDTVGEIEARAASEKTTENTRIHYPESTVAVEDYTGMPVAQWSIQELDEEYAAAVKRKDWRTAEDMLLEKMQRTPGITGYRAAHFYNGEHKVIAKMIKENYGDAIAAAVEEMAPLVPENAALVPMPPHEGKVLDDTDTMILARALGEATGRPVIVALESDAHKSRNQAKKTGDRSVTAESMGFRQAAEIPEDMMPVFVDNMVGGGTTAIAAKNAIGRGITLAYGQSARAKSMGVKDVSVTYDKKGKLIPLSQRMDPNNKSWKYSFPEETSNGIRKGMLDGERYQKLAGTEVVAYNSYGKISENRLNKFSNMNYRNAVDPFTDLAREYGLINSKDAKAEPLDNKYLKGIEVVFSKLGIKESVHHQEKGLGNLAALFPVFRETFKEAVPVLMQDDRYKLTVSDESTVDTYLYMLGAYTYGKEIVPVQFEIKFPQGRKGNLYVVATIEKDAIMSNGPAASAASALNTASSDISIDEIIRHVKPEQTNMLQMLPSEFLSRAQLDGKRKGLREKGAYLQRKAKDRKKTNTDTVHMTEKRIDNAIKEFEKGGYKAYVTSIDPEMFVLLTTQKKERIENESRVLIASELRSQEETPYLIVNEKTGEILGEEGRHRMIALANAGVKNAAILVIPYSTEEGDTNLSHVESMDINGKGRSAQLSNLIPVSEENRNEIINTYGNKGKSWFMYSIQEGEIRNADGELLAEELQRAIEHPVSKFSMQEPVEVNKAGLIAVHNLEEEQLLKTLRLGGFPMPSIAIIKNDYAHNRYGGVSVVFYPSAIDPQASRFNKVYGGDAWTPTYPTLEYKISSKELKKITDKIIKLVPKYITEGRVELYPENLQKTINSRSGNIVNALKNNMQLQMAYLADKGIKYDMPMRQEQLSRSNFKNEQILYVIDKVGMERLLKAHEDGISYFDEHPEVMEEIRQALNEQAREELKTKITNDEVLKKLSKMDLYEKEKFGFSKAYPIVEAVFKYNHRGNTINQEVNEPALRDVLKEKINQEDFEKWIREQTTGLIEKTGLRNNKSYYTNTGNPRSWEALHDEETLDNIVNIMRGQDEKGANAFFSQSAMLALGTRNFKTMNDVRKHSDQLMHISDEELSAAKTNIVESFGKLMDEMKDPSERNEFIARDRALQAMVEAVRKSKTPAGIMRELRQWHGLRITNEVGERIAELVEEIANLPTEYFEAKPQRAVGLDEVAKVILPEGTGEELIRELESRNVPYETYDGTDEGRLKALNDQTDAQFSFQDVTEMDVQSWMMSVNPNTLQTEAEKALLRQYKDLQMRVGLKRMQERELREQIRTLEELLKKNQDSSRVQGGTETLENALEEAGATIRRDGKTSFVYKDGEAVAKLYGNSGIKFIQGISEGVKNEFELAGFKYNEKAKAYFFRSEGRTAGTRDLERRLKGLRVRLENATQVKEQTEEKLAQITSTEGYGRMMRDQNRIFNDFMYGRTQAEVQEAVERLEKGSREIAERIVENLKAVNEMEKSDAIRELKEKLGKTTVDQMVSELKNEFHSTWTKAELRAFVDPIIIKMSAGEDFDTDIQELAEILISSDSRNTYEGLEALRGLRITVGHGEMTEIHARNSSLREYRARLAGTGITLRAAKKVNGHWEASTLESDVENLRQEFTEMPELGGEKDALENFTLWVENMKKRSSPEQQQFYAEQLANTMATIMQKAAATATGIYIPSESRAQKQVLELVEFVKSLKARTEKAEKTLQDIALKSAALHKAGIQAAGMARALTDNVGEALQYYDRTAKLAIDQAKQKRQDATIEQLKSEHAQKILKINEEWRNLIERDNQARRQAENNAAERSRINTALKRMFRLLRDQKPVKNMPEYMQGLAREVLESFVDNDFGGGRKLMRADEKQLTEMKRLLTAWKEQNGPFSLADLDDAQSEEEAFIKNQINQDLLTIYDGIEKWNGEIRGKNKLDTLKQRGEILQQIQEAVGEIYSVIQAERTVQINRRKFFVEDLAADIREDIGGKKAKEWKGKGSRAIRQLRSFIISGNMTPEYFFRTINNAGLSQLWEAYHEAENRNGLELAKAQSKLDEIAKEHGYDSWDMKEKLQVRFGSKTVEMTRGQLMSLWATWNREKTLGPAMSEHLSVGGFYAEQDLQEGKLGKTTVEKKATRVHEEDIAGIEELLTDEQKAFVNDVVEFMSTDMSKLGNAASMAAYGIKMYKEAYYFPFQMWDGIRSRKSNDAGKGANADRAFHPSFSITRMHGANNALVISDFMTTAADHIAGMINYATMGLANETFQKVLNAQLQEDFGDEQTRRNIRTMLEEAYGMEAMQYLNELQMQLNGGAVKTQKTIGDKAISLFRKNAVAGSLSVALQQPLSYIRAAMMINPKYLAQALAREYWKGSYQELLQHSGVAVIKNMGRFDMNFGQSAREFLMPEGMRGTAKKAWDAVVNASTILPEKMDAWTWTRMWVAVKAEQHDLHPEMDVKSDEFLDMCGTRFNDIMRRTQVYDSVLVKSANMRSDSYFMKGFTSFMAEPTLTLNVLADAVRQVKNGEKGGMKAVATAAATFLLSAVLQAAVKGAAGAGRNPDEKKTRLENFLYRFQSNLLNEVNPLSMIPGYSDLITALKGGDLKDDAMGTLQKLWDAVKGLYNFTVGNTERDYRAFEDTVGQIVQLVSGVPMKNIMRDARMMWNYIIKNPFADRETSAAVLKYQAVDVLANADSMLGVLNKQLGDAGWMTNNTAYYQRIYEAKRAGNEQAAEDMEEYLITGKGVKPESVKSGVLSAARKDGDATAAETADFLAEEGGDAWGYVRDQLKAEEITAEEARELLARATPEKSAEEIWWTVDRIEYQRTTGTDKTPSGYYYRLTDAVNNNSVKEIQDAVRMLMVHGVERDNIKKKLSDWKSEYLAADSRGRVRIRNAIQVAYKALGFSAADADKVIDKWK